MQLSQSLKHSSPSNSGSVFVNNCVGVLAVLKPLLDKSALEALGVKRLTRFFSMFRGFWSREKGELEEDEAMTSRSRSIRLIKVGNDFRWQAVSKRERPLHIYVEEMVALDRFKNSPFGLARDNHKVFSYQAIEGVRLFRLLVREYACGFGVVEFSELPEVPLSIRFSSSNNNTNSGRKQVLASFFIKE